MKWTEMNFFMFSISYRALKKISPSTGDHAIKSYIQRK